MWQSLTFGYSYKCSLLHSPFVLPGVMLLLITCRTRRLILRRLLTRLYRKKNGLPACRNRAEVAVKKILLRKPVMSAPYKTEIYRRFLMGVTLTNPLKAKDVNLRIPVQLQGKRRGLCNCSHETWERSMFIREQKARQIWSSTQTRGLDKIP